MISYCIVFVIIIISSCNPLVFLKSKNVSRSNSVVPKQNVDLATIVKYSMTFKSSLYLKLSSKEWREMVEEEGQVKVQRSEQNNGSQLSFLLLFIFKIKPHTGHTSIDYQVALASYCRATVIIFFFALTIIAIYRYLVLLELFKKNHRLNKHAYT